MLKPQIGTILVKCHDNSLYLESKDARNNCTNFIEFPREENGVQYKVNVCSVPKEKGKHRRRNNLNKSYNIDHNRISKEQAGESTITLTRRIPNILKNNPKVLKTVKEPLDKVVNMKENIQEPYGSIITLDSSSSEKSYVETDNKCKKSTRKRKQEHNFIDMWQKSPTWNIHTFVDDNKEIKNCKKGRRTRASTRNNKGSNKLPALETKKHNENSLPPTSHNISAESMTKFHVASYLGETTPIDMEDFIDFSSNEIFSNYDFTEYAIDFSKTFNSSSTIYNSEICEKEYDMNANEVDMDEIQCSTLSECLSENDKEPCYSSNSCCSYCHEDCATHWIAISEKNNMLSMKDRVLSDNVVINDSEMNSQVKINCSCLPVAEADINSTNESFNEKFYESYSRLPISAMPNNCTSSEKCNENSLCLLNEEHNESNSYMDTSNIPEIVSQYILENVELSPMESTISCIEDIEEGILNEFTEIENTECNTYNDDNFLNELDLALASLEAKEMDTLQAQVHTEEDVNRDELQCLLCSLTFYSARTLAMHQAGAHGGISFIAVVSKSHTNATCARNTIDTDLL
ncbi:uncharacterized protein LOC143212602 isoform X2 [Lasioglossum baleicum]|uniref:uncharacterized protein LOC143212602 isoform X2 n=1 Tax=Lasioglossum baleicum TaxID=434251 RepID=UPI003FCDB03C